MISNEQLLLDHKKHPFLWMGVFSLGVSIVLAKLNIYLGTQVNYLNYLSLFNVMILTMLACVGISIILSIAGLWRSHFRSVPLALMSLASSVFLILIFLIS